MTFGTILVHLDHTDRCAARAVLAVRLARTHGSHLVGLVPTGLQDGIIPADAVATGVSDYIAESADYLRRRAEAIIHGFRDRIGAAGTLSYEVRQTEEPAVDAVVNHGRASDLIILGQSERDGSTDPMTSNLAQQVMLQAGRPVLVVPYAGSFDDIGKKVILAWDGSREAALAMRDALPLLGQATHATLLAFGRADGYDNNGRLHLTEMARWLARHEVRVTVEERVTDIAYSDALLSHASDLGADLIVMGGYGHARLRELVLGGVTRDMLARMTVPVLMAH